MKIRWAAGMRLCVLATLPLLTGCGAKKPDIDVLGLINQPQTAVEQKLGKAVPLSGDDQLQVFPPPKNVESVYMLFSSEGHATKIIVQFSSASGTSLEALERVGLGENGLGRPIDSREETGWTYLNQEFGGIRFSKVRTIGGTGKYWAVSAEL